MAYIYKITNQINNKAYIGKTEQINPELRWKEHIKASKRKECKNRALYKAINKYGINNFIFTIIEETDSPNDREQYYIQYFNTYHNGYNETLGGDGSAYLELPEQEICKYYLAPHSIDDTASYFGHDEKTIIKILYKNNIKMRTMSEARIIASSYPVAKLDKDTEEIIEIYPSLKAAEYANGNTHHISDVIKGTRKTCKGFKWKKI